MPIYKDEKTGNWYVKCYYQDYTGTKKQKLKRGFKLQREAKEWERSFLEKMQGTPDMTFQALYDLYIEDMSHRLRASSIETKKCILNKSILPYFKDKPVNTITPADVRKWQNEMMNKDYSEYYLHQLHITLSAVFSYAVQYYNLDINPCSRAGSMGRTTRSMNFWTLEQYNTILGKISDIRVYTALQVLFYSGIRCGEMLALELSDIDFEQNTISITKTLHHTEEGYKVAPPKTENGTRVVTMPIKVMEDIKAYCGKIYGLSSSDRIFTFSSQLIRRAMNAAVIDTDIPKIRIHDIRHSHVSLLIDMGFTPHLVADRIGDSVQMVNSVYGHLYPTKHKEVADRLNKLLVSK